MTIAGKGRVVPVVDGGSSVVAMLSEVCCELKLVYDPAICIKLESANGTEEWSLGLLMCSSP